VKIGLLAPTPHCVLLPLDRLKVWQSTQMEPCYVSILDASMVMLGSSSDSTPYSFIDLKIMFSLHRCGGRFIPKRQVSTPG
jgi:hypothetical protein